MRRVVGLAVAVVAAMALGRAVTELLPVDQVDVKPFVRTGVVGKPVHLSYADVTVSHVLVARRLYGADPVKAAGRFLVLDLRLRASRESTFLQGFDLYDAQGRRYAPMSRGASCAEVTTAPTGVPWWVRVCFDVPRSALAGAHVVVARGPYDVDGSGQRRDDQARVDIGISDADATRLWAKDVAYDGYQDGFGPVSTTPTKESK